MQFEKKYIVLHKHNVPEKSPSVYGKGIRNVFYGYIKLVWERVIVVLPDRSAVENRELLVSWCNIILYNGLFPTFMLSLRASQILQCVCMFLDWFVWNTCTL